MVPKHLAILPSTLGIDLKISLIVHAEIFVQVQHLKNFVLRNFIAKSIDLHFTSSIGNRLVGNN